MSDEVGICKTCIYWHSRGKGGAVLCRRKVPPWEGTYDTDWCGDGLWMVNSLPTLDEYALVGDFVELKTVGRKNG